ncbi:unnamed protein product, partial [Timema podura]|nr:unnamed protein product [Timema podura]
MQEGNLTTKKLEESFAGNTCRCTGYRPILDAFKSLCVDAPLELKNKCLDIEDLQKINRCCKQCVTCKKKLNSDDDDDLGAISIPGFIPSETPQWFRVKTIEEIFNIFSSIGNIPYQLVAGNTAHETPQWFRVKTIEEIFNIFSSIGNIPYQLVAGNTAH